MVAGVVAGAALARPVVDLFGVHDSLFAPLIGILVLIGMGSLGSSVGFWVGEPIRRRILAGHGGVRLDSAFGALISIVAVVAVSWFLGLSLSRIPNPTVAGAIQRSVILRYLDGIAPRPPGFLAGVEQVIGGAPFPSVFSGLEPIFEPPLAVPASVDTAGVSKAANATVEVRSIGVNCNGIVTGSGFPVAPGYIVTNAHVVAGTRDTTIIQSGAVHRATVVLFDPERDVAVLDVPGLRLQALGDGDPTRGTQGAVIGYPEGGPEQVAPAVVDQQVNAEGRDIYNQNLVVRQILVIGSTVKPGNSGGPLVDLQGNVLGMVFAASTSDPNRAYALANGELAPDLQSGVGRTQAVGTGDQCAV